jgi:hypothetical protein
MSDPIETGAMARIVHTQAEAFKLMDKLLAAAQVDAVYGKPIQSGDYTVILASEVSAGGGFGSGYGDTTGQPDQKLGGSGAGGGGGSMGGRGGGDRAGGRPRRADLRPHQSPARSAGRAGRAAGRLQPDAAAALTRVGAASALLGPLDSAARVCNHEIGLTTDRKLVGHRV